MIITRYLIKQVLQVTLAVTFVLVVIVVVGRLLKYLVEASQGQLDPGILALLMAYRVPEFVQLIVPLALLLGILLAYGRMYADSEMTVLHACGLSRARLCALTFVPAMMIASAAAFLALTITPWGLANTGALLEAQEELTEFEILVPGLFQNISRGERTTYTEEINGDVLRNVFMYEREANRVTLAASAIPSEDEQGNRFVLFRDGSVTEGVTGQQPYTVAGFDEMGLRLPPREINFDVTVEEKGMPTAELFAATGPAAAAELQWRFSLIILILVLTLAAVPLSRVSPREGRFARLVPAIVIYIAYFGLLLACRDLMKSGSLPEVPGMLWVHGLFLAVALLLYREQPLAPPPWPRLGRKV